MTRIGFIFLIFLSLLFWGCSETNTNQSKSKIETSENLDTFQIDPKVIQTRIQEFYKIVDTFYNEKINRIDTLVFDPIQTVCSINLNGDNWNDYFVVVDYHGGPSAGFFHDGKTGKPFSFYDKHDLVLSRPGIDIEFKVIDINCEDNQKEILIRTGGGGTIGNYYDLQLFRFDKNTNTVKLIFRKSISFFEWSDDLSIEEPLEINYININYSTKNCIDTIIVQEGVLESNEPYDLNISPKEKSGKKFFILNEEKNSIERIK